MRSRRRARRLFRSRRVGSSEPCSRDASRVRSQQFPERVHHVGRVNLLEAACSDGAGPRLPGRPGRAHRGVVRVRPFDRPARFVAAIADDRPAIGPRPEVDGPVPIDPDGRRSLLRCDVRQTGVDADDTEVTTDRMSEEELLKGLEGLTPPESQPEPDADAGDEEE